MSKTLPFQSELRPALPTVIGNVDYQKFEKELKRMDEVLILSGVEKQFVESCVANWLESAEEGQEPSARDRREYQKHSRRAMRCNVLQRVLGESFRGMSRRLAECALFQWFCGVDQLGVVEVPSKSQLQRYTQWVTPEELDELIGGLLQSATRTEIETGENALKLVHQIELDAVWLDSTCVKANIHFPVDWRLLGDATRTLMQATALIRNHGLKNRMEEPGAIISRMNKLCMEMTQCRRKEESKKERKRVLRKMKKVVKIVRDHALRHRDLLESKWKETDWSRGYVDQVIGRINKILKQLPKAIKQAHERIIGERQVKNQEKILSLYETDVHVIVRGKSGAEVEFGNTLLIGEQAQGLVVDWKLYEESAPADSKQLKGSLERIGERIGKGTVKAVGGDRGFDSQANRELLKEKEMFNGLCPKNINDLKEAQKESRFSEMAKRRAQTEGRIGILKNCFFGNPMMSKGIESRKSAVGWSVFAHNLWVLARLERIKENQSEERAQAA